MSLVMTVTYGLYILAHNVTSHVTLCHTHVTLGTHDLHLLVHQVTSYVKLGTNGLELLGISGNMTHHT